MPKQKDWSFYVKITTAGIFLFFAVIILLFGSKGFQPMDDDEQQKKDIKPPTKTKIQRPLRMRLIVLNSITMFFLLMSIQEYRLNEFMSPFGVDPDNIPAQCKTQQEMFYWVALTACFVIVVYNFFIQFNVLKKATAGNVIVEQKNRDSVHGYVGRANSAIARLSIKNGGFVVETYPFFLEFAFSVLLTFFSGIFYIMLVLINYNVIQSNIFKPCFHPQNTTRFYDPFAEENHQ